MDLSIPKIKNGVVHQKCIKIRMQTGNENILVFYSDEDFLRKVNRQKLLEKSDYFRAITKTCYKDHLSDFIEMEIPASYVVFSKVMGFINNGVITLDVKTVLETCHLAVYLQIDCLQQLCLDHFTTNLNRKTLESQLYFIEDHLFLGEEFSVRASMFRNSKSPSFSGLYFLQEKYHKKQGEMTVGKSLKIFSKQFASVHELAELKQTDFHSLHQFEYLLCALVQDVFLFQYHLVSGETNVSMIESLGRRGRDEYVDNAIFCSNSDAMFVVSKVKYGYDDCLISVFHKQNFTDFLVMSHQKRFNIVMNEQYEDYKLWFSHCYDEKIYIFYSCYNSFHTKSNDLYLLTVCDKSLKTLKDQKLSNNIKLDRKVDQTVFEKMFYFEKEEKLFIKNPTSRYSYDEWDMVLVFDMKNDRFYYTEHFLPSRMRHTLNDDLEFKFALGKDDEVYGIRQYHLMISGNQFQYRTEIRKFRLDDDKLVDDVIAWEEAADYSVEDSEDFSEITSLCFV